MIITAHRLQPGELDHERVWLGVGALTWLAAVASTYVAPLPAFACPFKWLTGWPCIGCGGTRAWLALSGGLVPLAFRLNPLAAIAGVGWVLWAGYAAVALMLNLPRVRLSWSDADRTHLRIVLATAVAIVWIFLAVDGR